MPYFGASVDLDKFRITVRIHGPWDDVPQHVLSEIKSYVIAQPVTYDQNNIPLVCLRLAEDIKERYLDGTTMLWVQVEIITKQNLIFGASAEKVLV